MNQDQDVKPQDRSDWLELAEGGGLLFVDPAPPTARTSSRRSRERRFPIIVAEHEE